MIAPAMPTTYEHIKRINQILSTPGKLSDDQKRELERLRELIEIQLASAEATRVHPHSEPLINGSSSSLLDKQNSPAP
jgi:hypothetical protein